MTETAASLRDDLITGRARLLAVVAGVSEEQFKRRPEAPPPSHSLTSGMGLNPEANAAAEIRSSERLWSIAEVLAHLLYSHKLRAERIALALDQDGIEIVPSDPALHEETARAGRLAPVPQLIHGLLAVNREVDRLLEGASQLENGLERCVVHPQQGRQSIAWMLREKIIEHEVDHMAQIESIKTVLGTARSAQRSSSV
jgi:uncharacterized damage-inducible protein DinB